jgi:hypothetical protein
LTNYEAQQKYIQVVHNQIREQGLLTLNVASYLVPIPPAGELRIAGKLGSLALKLFKFKRGIQAIEVGSHVVYAGRDAAGVIRYVGITGREAAVRFGEHYDAVGTGREL